MNLETAIQRAADWWMEQIAGGKWDNGDPHTEFQHAIFAAITPGPTALQLPVLREAIIDAIRSQRWENSINGTVCYQLYADYGCRSNNTRSPLAATHGLHQITGRAGRGVLWRVSATGRKDLVYGFYKECHASR